MDEDAFLPSENDRLKAQLKEMRRRLAAANIRDKQLRKELLEEDLSYITVSSLVDKIQDPTRGNENEFDEITKEVFAKMVSTVESCCIKEAISYHRLAGRSIFKFKGNRSCIRLETFYNRTYKESYYILYEKGMGHIPRRVDALRPSLIDHHTIPSFIRLDTIAKIYLPDNFDTFIRIIHDQVQAYVTKREILKEIANLEKTHTIEIKYQSESIHKAEIEVSNIYGQRISVDLFFDDKSSSYPTKAIIRDITHQKKDQEAKEADNFADIARQFKQKPISDILMELLQTSLRERNIWSERHMDID